MKDVLIKLVVPNYDFSALTKVTTSSTLRTLKAKLGITVNMRVRIRPLGGDQTIYNDT